MSAPALAAALILLAPPSPAAAQAQAAAAKAAASKSAKAAKAAAQAAEDAADTLSEVVVTANRPQPGAVIGDIKPELQLGPADIQSYGVSTVAELLNELSPQTRSDRGRGGEGPVVLLNGRRISGFNEIRDIPTEAIARVDILPEEVALKYGYTANQRVINIVLRRRFRAITTDAEAGAATEGGAPNGLVQGDILRIRGDNRTHFDLKYTGAGGLLESDRDLQSLTAGQLFSGSGAVTSAVPGGEIDPRLSALAGRTLATVGVPTTAPETLVAFAGAPQPGVVDDRNLRSLTPDTQSISANGVLARTLPWRMSGTVNATLGATSSDSEQGLAGLSLLVPAGDPFSPFASDVRLQRQVGADPLRQSTDGWTAHLGGTLNRDTGSWRLSLTGAYDHADSHTKSDTGLDGSTLQALLTGRSSAYDPFAPLTGDVPRLTNRAQSDTDTANSQLLVNGPVLKVPAGQLYGSFKVGDTQSWLSSTSQRLGIDQQADFSRNDFNAQGNLDLPIASRRNHVAGWLGELSLNGNAAIDQLSDFGALDTLGYGLNWRPVTGLTVILSHTHDEAAPTVTELGGPTIVTAAARIFDYVQGRTVDVTRIDGGNPALTGDKREVSKIGVTWKPFVKEDLTFTANYIVSRIDNAIQSFPAATTEIEAAFPDRFQRDATGTLTQVDFRPVNFQREDREELRWGVNYSRTWRPKWLPAYDYRSLAPPGGFRGRFGGGEGRGGGGDGATRGGRGDGGDQGRPPRQQGEGSPPAPADGSPPANADGASPGSTGGADASGRGGGFGGGGFGGGSGFGGGGGGRGGGAPRDGRLQFAVYHTVFFTDTLLVRPGVPVFDLLNGSASGSTGGQPQHEVEAQAGYSVLGVGARMSFDWKSGTTVRGGVGGSSTGDLDFSDLATVSLRLFANLGQMPPVVKKHPFLRGSRVTLSLTNLFDQRIQVRDATGATPISYQPAYLDPTGRTFRLAFRKLFY